MKGVEKWALLALIGLAACDKPGPPSEPPASSAAAEDVLRQARARVVPPGARVRFQIKVRSEALDLAGSTGGGLVLGRPGRGRLDVLGPLGSPLVSIAADGTALDALLTRKGRHLRAASADAVIQEMTEGAAGLDDLLAVLQGDLPFDSAPAQDVVTLEDGSVRLTLQGPKSVRVTADLDPELGTPRHIEAVNTEEDRLLIAVDYESFSEADGVLWPDALTLTVPALDLVAGLDFKTWAALDEVPDVFALTVPESIVTEDIETVVRELAAKREEAGD